MKHLIFLLSILTFNLSYSQIVSDKIIKTSGESQVLFSKTNAFLNEFLPNHKVISTEDNKLIHISDRFTKTVSANTWNVEYTFYYTVKFYHKNDSVKVVYTLQPQSKSLRAYQNSSGTTLNAIAGTRPIYNEYNENNSSYENIDVSGNFPGFWSCGYGREKFEEVCRNVKSKPEELFSNYIEYMSKNTNTEDGW